MHQSMSSLLPFALLLISASAAPTDDGYSKVHRVSTGNQKTKNGLIQVEKVYKKYSWTMPEGLSDAAGAAREKIAQSSGSGTPQIVQQLAAGQNMPQAVGSVTATPQIHNSEFLCPVTIGQQVLQLDLDTGSSDLWIYNTQVPDNEKGNHSLYDPSKSSSHSSTDGQTFTLTYGDGTSLSGSVAADRVQIGGIAVDNQAIELPSSVSSGISTDNSDGIIGLGFQSINSISQNGGASPQPTWFENAMWRLTNPVFTCNLKAGKAGTFQFGQVDNTAYKDGTLWYSKVDNSTGYWGFDSTQYAVGSGSTQTNSNSDSMAIADTGSSLLFVNPAPFNAFYANVNGQTVDKTTGMTTYPCSETLPDFHVSLGTQMATIPGSMLNYMPDSNKGPNGEDMCVGGIQSNDGQAPQVYGDILFQTYFAVFDYGNMQIGFAPHA